MHVISLAKCIGSNALIHSSSRPPIRTPPRLHQSSIVPRGFDHRTQLQPPVAAVLSPDHMPINNGILPREIIQYAIYKLKMVAGVLRSRSRVRLNLPRLRAEGISIELFSRTIKDSFVNHLTMPDSMLPQLAIHLCNHMKDPITQLNLKGDVVKSLVKKKQSSKITLNNSSPDITSTTKVVPDGPLHATQDMTQELWGQEGLLFPHASSPSSPFGGLPSPPPLDLPDCPMASILKRHLLLFKPSPYLPPSKLEATKLDDYILDLYIGFMKIYQSEEIEKAIERRTFFHLSSPHEWFPFARAIHRKIIYHSGPTNSGKTHNAVEALKAASSGIYCSPLRLLALEQYDRLNQAGVLCDLLTGEEKKLIPGASHTSCTIEMTSLLRRYQVAVIDEIQMIGDLDRGSAWTRALLGVAASEVHLCGDGSALGLVRSMCLEMGEELEVKTYERSTPLVLEPEPLKSIEDVKEGDCVIVFSYRDVYKTKKEIETKTDLKACIVYGALPAETRKDQAKLFNTPGSGYNVLVATDAIGMGLNLNIRRVVFSTLHKTTMSKKGPSPAPLQIDPVTSDEKHWAPSKSHIKGNSVSKMQLQPLSASAVKQIAGRAGRRGSIYPEGFVTCLKRADIRGVNKALALTLPSQQKAGIFPEPDQIESLALSMPDELFAKILSKFEASEVILGKDYVMCNHVALQWLAGLIDQVSGLSTSDRLRLCMAPVRYMHEGDSELLLHYVRSYAAGVLVHPPRPFAPGSRRFELIQRLKEGQPLFNVTGTKPAETVFQIQAHMQDLEGVYRALSLWSWLSFRLERSEELFLGRSNAAQDLALVREAMTSLLQVITGTKLPYSIQAGTEKRRGKASSCRGPKR